MKRILIFILIAIGIVLQFQFLPPRRSVNPYALLIGAVIFILVGWFRLPVGFKLLQKRLDQISERTSLLICLCIFVISSIYFPTMNLYVGREMHPAMHDDQMHAIQTQMLATGRLWLPQHPAADFFETFHVYVKPLYAPCHFPGTAILNVFGVWLHLPTWFIPNLMMAASCALAYHIARRITSTTFALLVPLFLLFSPIIYILAPMIMSQNAMLFLGLLWIAVFLEWQKSCRTRWAVLLGLIGGLSAITRPVDAIAFGIAILIGILIVLYQRKDRRLAIKTIAIGVFCVLPFVGFQLFFNHSIAGDYLVTPYKQYCDQNYPDTIYPDHAIAQNTESVRVSALQQKQDLYKGFMIKTVRRLQGMTAWFKFIKVRIPMTLQLTIPNTLLYFLLPLALVGINSVKRFVACAPAIIFFILYFPHAFYAEHYIVIIAVPIALILLVAITSWIELLQKYIPGNWAAAFWIILLISCVSQGVQFFQNQANPFRVYKSVNFVQEQLPKIAESPALVFCKYDAATCNYHDEPVYNYHAARIDDNPIVLAQWLGARNIELVDYYRKIGQNRTVYELDRGSLTLTRIGKVNELSK